VIARGFFGRWPLAWVGFALLVLGVPAIGFARERGADLGTILPAVNATLNATSAALVLAGWRAIRARRVEVHWRCMVSATVVSAVFLVVYLARVALTGVHRYPAGGWSKSVYLAILGSHTLLAAAVPFLVAATLLLAARKRFDRHRRLARWTLPIWLYVSVTGVLVYLMLYHLAPALD
jgi:putative membrane protein